ncbi:ATP-dependent DNA helicase PIF1-like [Macadamia integrifolia]|uniref:ATP-dependent DNA helicase PIF1-like n=1 Tax=Macadamia integrifolia TaxID=60698 RepID=UPI001C4F26B3|nr:ATP-dependent DNA helicase PIF1-like [Macadamia integrifolia]
MPGGRTAHSRFKIPININDSSVYSFSKQSATAELIRKVKLIIWDEAPMAKRQAIEALDRTLQDITGNSESFGGKVVIFGGDFRQVLPVVPRATRTETVDASLVMSYLWPKMKKLQLTTNMRAINDSCFSEFLLRVGNGEELTKSEDLIRIPDEMVIEHQNDGKSEDDLINAIFPSLQQHAHSTEYITQRAILATKNDTVDKLNEKLIELFPGESVTYYSFDSATDDAETQYPEEFLNSLAPKGLPPHKLVLKKNCPIMLLRNLNPSHGECNGTRLVCRQFQKNVILAEIAVGQFTGNLVPLPRIPLSPTENEGYPFHLKREQFPIRLSFAMTINKSQGQTIPHVGVYLPEPVFSHGQLYVALSRGISMSTTKVLVKNAKIGKKSGSYTKNVVYKEVLLPKRINDLTTSTDEE